MPTPGPRWRKIKLTQTHLAMGLWLHEPCALEWNCPGILVAGFIPQADTHHPFYVDPLSNLPVFKDQNKAHTPSSHNVSSSICLVREEILLVMKRLVSPHLFLRFAKASFYIIFRLHQRCGGLYALKYDGKISKPCVSILSPTIVVLVFGFLKPHYKNQTCANIVSFSRPGFYQCIQYPFRTRNTKRETWIQARILSKKVSKWLRPAQT